MGIDRKQADRLVGDDEVAKRLSMSRSWVRQQRSKRREGQPHVLAIDPIKIGERSVRYLEAELDALVDHLTAAHDNNAAD